MTLVMNPERHPGTQHFKHMFDYDHLPPSLQEVSRTCHRAAQIMVDNLKDGPELSAGLRKLVEAKDCFVRQAVWDITGGDANVLPKNTPEWEKSNGQDQARS